MGMRERRGVKACRDETREVGHVDEEEGTDAIRNLAHLGEVDDAGDGAAACDDQLRLMLGRKLGELVVVQRQVLLPHAILDSVEPLAGLVWGGAVGEVAAGVERHAKDGVAGLDQRLEDALVGLGTGVRLDVSEGAVEKLLRPVNCQVLGHVDELAAAVVALARVAFGILVGHHRALRLHHGAGDDVFAGDQFDLMALAAEFLSDGAVEFGVAGGQGFGEKAGVAVGSVHGVSSEPLVCAAI